MTMQFSDEALGSWQTAAARVCELLGEASTGLGTAAQADLSAFGVLGSEFAATWARVVGQHAGTLAVAAALVENHSQILGGYGQQVVSTDTGTAAALTARANVIAS